MIYLRVICYQHNGGDIVFESGFPYKLQDYVHNVQGRMSLKIYNNIPHGVSDNSTNEQYLLLDGSTVSFPYRIYFMDDEKIYNELEAVEEKIIYSCIFTRSFDGYVRQRHLRKILTENYPQWCMPYILKLSSEYVAEIINDIYEYMETRDNTLFQIFCANNAYMFRHSYSRMVSYWNEFYRGSCYKFHDYVGYRLYKQCFGDGRKYDKL